MNAAQRRVKLRARALLDSAPVQMIGRAAAAQKLRLDPYIARVIRNYELEGYLSSKFGGHWCISEWCPFNGRFCTLMGFAPKPWPFLSGERRDQYSERDCSDAWKLPSLAELQAIANAMPKEFR